MNDILLRSLTGAIFVGVLIGALMLGPLTTAILFFIFTVFGLGEYYKLINTSNPGSNSLITGLTGGAIFYILLVYSMIIDLTFSNEAFIYILFALILPIELYRKKTNPIQNVATLLFGWLYLVIPFYLVVKLSWLHWNMDETASGLIGLFILVWTNDSFAYLTGRFFGRTKLFERISPKKTWEGTIGGVAFAVIAGLIICNIIEQEVVFWIVAALIAALGSIFGDLFESLFKRSVGVKDSGNILPGHGGILDRFDAVIFALPFFYAWVVIFG